MTIRSAIIKKTKTETENHMCWPGRGEMGTGGAAAVGNSVKVPQKIKHRMT